MYLCRECTKKKRTRSSNWPKSVQSKKENFEVNSEMCFESFEPALNLNKEPFSPNESSI